MDEKPRLARLTAIVTQLQSGRIVKAKDLAQRHGVSIRTIYRDIRTLEQSGIPVVTEEGKGYSMVEGFKLPPIAFTEEETNALVTAEQLMLQNKDQSLAENYLKAITKIKAVLDYQQKDKVDLLVDRMQVRSRSGKEESSSFLIQLQSAITNFQLVKIQYLSEKGQNTERKVEPFALYTTQGNWILIAFCRYRNDFRAFRLDRIQALFPLNEQFESHGMTLEAYFEECKKNWETSPDIPLSLPPSTFDLKQNNNMEKVEIKPFNFIGIAVRTSHDNGQAAQDIGNLWNRFLSENMVPQIPNKVSPEVFSLYTDYEGDYTQPYTAMLGCKVSSLDEIPDGMEGRTIGGGTYVQLSARGKTMEGFVAKKWLEIWGMGLDRNYHADFEVYGEKAMNPEDAEVDFFVGVK